MPINYGNASPADKGFIWESKTDHDSREAYEGERFSPVIHVGDADRAVVAPYLPFSTDLVKEFEAFTVIRRHKLVSMDEQGFIVPANGILKVYDGDAYYEARPLVYATRDHGLAGAAYGDWAIDNPPVNMNAFDGEQLESGDLNTENVVTGTISTDATAGGIASRTYVGVTAARFPIGIVTDKVLSRAGVYQYREYDPQRTLTVLTHRVVLFTERAAHRHNYSTATLAAIVSRNALVGSATDAAIATIAQAATDIPRWARGEAGGSDVNDMILPGDLVMADSAGDFVRLDVRVNNYNAQAGGAGSSTDLELNGAYPLAAMNAVVGRCSARETVVVDAALALVKTYKNSTDVGGIGTSGVEKILTRGDAMTAGEFAGIAAAAEDHLNGAPVDLEFDAVDGAEYGLLIHLNLV